MTTPPPLDADCAAALEAFPLNIGEILGMLTDESIGDVRGMFAQMPEPELSGTVSWTDHDVPGSEGAVVRVHRPNDASGALPCLYWIHGGGMVIGAYDQEDARMDAWCSALNCVGVSVEYRLAPEHQYPAALDDCLAGLAWVIDNAADIGVDPSRVGIGGASAGAGLGAALALRARDETDLAIAFQLLIYPMLDDRQTTVSSQWHEHIWPPSANTYGWSAYLGDAKGGTDVSPYAAPARATDLAGLPPTFVMVGSVDGFVDEDIDYANRLNQAGVEVELHVYPGGPHGFDSLAAGTPLADRAARDTQDWLAAQL